MRTPTLFTVVWVAAAVLNLAFEHWLVGGLLTLALLIVFRQAILAWLIPIRLNDLTQPAPEDWPRA